MYQSYIIPLNTNDICFPPVHGVFVEDVPVLCGEVVHGEQSLHRVYINPVSQHSTRDGFMWSLSNIR